MKKLRYLALFLIIILAAFLRLYRLDLNIPSIYADEAYHYSALSSIYDGFQPRLLSLSFTWIFGLNPFGVRSASALYGVIVAICIYFLSKSITKKDSVALISALLVAILPWNFMLSRIGHSQVPLLLIFTTIHTSLFIRATNIRGYLLSFIPLFMGLMFYPSMVIIFPLIALMVFVFIYNKLPPFFKKIALIVLVPFVLLTAIYVFIRFDLLNPNGRGLELAIWNNVNTPYEIDRYRSLSWNSPLSLFSFGTLPENIGNKIVYNRLVANLSVFARNYLSFFSPDWLFLKGDSILRHSTGQVGAFYLFLMPFMIYGAHRFFQNSEKKVRLTFIIWILVSPLPAAITKDGAGYLLRVVTMLPFLTYFCALGIVESFGLFRKYRRIPYGIALGAIALYSAYYFFYGYFHVYPSLSERAYEYGFKDLSDFQTENRDESMLIIWDGYYHNLDFRFWQKTPFEAYKSFKFKEYISGQTTIWQPYVNLYFTNPKSASEVQKFIKENNVNYLILPDRYFVKYPTELDNLYPKVKEVQYPDKSIAFTIYKTKNK